MIRLATYIAIASMIVSGVTLGAGEGTAVGVKPDALSRLGSNDRLLVVGADVSVGETIVTGPTGNVQLLFDDATRLVVGPRSSLQIETYLLGGGGGASKFAVNALAGTFRFISGNSPKSAYSIDTPTASIAVRGTEFDLTVGGRQNFVLLFEGALRLCSGTTCVDLTRRCDLGVIGGGAADVLAWTNPERDGLVANFPLPNIQASFGTPFRVSGAQACLAAPQNGSSNSLVNLPPPGPPRNQTTPCNNPQIC
ncbi:FecR domain-containing protein [uncultured Devosia sp.]|mgnify:CR=1 FL=1|uniref:FecR family protein n=1 Tax=uncultured Devosia sp. TaxID=211434 RepID=UPI002616ABC6|nr:FecR domain-containing protein [uncultured Devosia sp.]